jgi:hypothetical protein
MDFSIWHWIIVIVAIAFWVAVGRYGMMIARRAGLPVFWGVLFGVPVLNIVAIWYMALARWSPVTRPNGER